MKKIIVILLLIIAACSNKKEIQKIAEISCGQCQLGLDGDGCSLAVRFDNKAYYIDGFGIDDFGDAHDKNTGFCNVIRKGKITGVIEDGKFLASDIKLSK